MYKLNLLSLVTGLIYTYNNFYLSMTLMYQLRLIIYHFQYTLAPYDVVSIYTGDMNSLSLETFTTIEVTVPRKSGKKPISHLFNVLHNENFYEV
jgi:hypothetical protein